MTFKQITIPAKTIAVTIGSITHQRGERVIVYLRSGSIGNNGEFVPDPPVITGSPLQFVIDGDAYADLLSANPEWAPNKPEGSFREDDLWRFIQL